MRRLTLVGTIVLGLAAPAHAAWVWVYGGEKHVLMPPEEGQPPWAGFPDANGDGQPDPVITKVDLRIEDEEGQTISRTRLGKTIRLVAQPELGGMELEPLSVTFRLTGPVGAVEVVPDEALKAAVVLGTAPAIYCASYTFPAPPSREFVGEWQASVAVKVGSTVFDTAERQAMALRVLGPRETTPEKVGRKVRGGLEKAGREVKEFGEKVAEEVEEWVAQQKDVEVPGALKPVQPRQTLGMVHHVVTAPGSPLAGEKSALSAERATGLRSRRGPSRSLLVAPFDVAPEPTTEGWFPLGYVVIGGMRPPGVADLQTALPWVSESGLRAGRIVLEAEPGAADGTVHFQASDPAVAGDLVAVPATVEWFNKVLWPGQTQLRVRRHPTPDADGLVDITLVSAVTGGAARVTFALPLVPLPESGAPPAPAETAPESPTPSAAPA